jgi:hypothetical protein
MRIKITPPIFEIKSPRLTKNLRNFSDLSKNNPVAINGAPKPMQYPRDKIAPRAAIDY